MHTAATATTTENDLVGLRQRAMRALADSPAEAIAACLSSRVPQQFEELRPPENGLVMVRGRVSGDGAPFNLGEATVTRAAIRLADGQVGFAYVLGRDKEKARLIALCDALIQSDARSDIIANVVVPLEQARERRRARIAAQAAATRVDFFTLVRGEG